MKLTTGIFLLLSTCSGLFLAGCAADEAKGLCSYLGGCGEADEDDDGATAPVIAPPKKKEAPTDINPDTSE